MTTTDTAAPRLTATQADDLLALVSDYGAANIRAGGTSVDVQGHAAYAQRWAERDAAYQAVAAAVYALAGMAVSR